MIFRKRTKIPGRLTSARYQIVEFLGSGSFGEVYKVIDNLNNNEKAIKIIIPPKQFNTEESFKFLEREASVALKINHPNVVQVYDYGTQEKKSVGKFNFIVMEYLLGGNLRSVLQATNSLPNPQSVLPLFISIINGLKAIHDVGIIHRDLKPENILFNNNKDPKINDFGLAKYIEEATRTKSFKGLGTFAYMAPETWEVKRATFATDIYSLGIIFYEILTSSLPFSGQNEKEWRELHLYGKISSLSDINSNVSVQLNGIIRKMMAKELNERYQNCDELLEVFKQTQEEQDKSNEIDISSVIDKAIKTHETVQEKRQRKQQEQEKIEEERRRINFKIDELLEKFDRVIEEANKHLIERKIDIDKNHQARIYRYYSKSLEINFFSSVIFCNLKDWQRKEIEKEGLIAVGFAQLNDGCGLHFLLIRKGDENYGLWYTAEVRDNALSRIRHSVEPFVITDLEELIENISYHFMPAMHITVIKQRLFTDNDITFLLGKLVEQ